MALEPEGRKAERNAGPAKRKIAEPFAGEPIFLIAEPGARIMCQITQVAFGEGDKSRSKIPLEILTNFCDFFRLEDAYIKQVAFYTAHHAGLCFD